MKRIALLSVICVILAGCASAGGGGAGGGSNMRWEKQGGTQDEFHRDRGQCIQAMMSTPFATTNDKMAIYASCLQGKGWYSVEAR